MTRFLLCAIAFMDRAIVGFGFALFAPMLLENTNHLLPSYSNMHHRIWMLGLLMAMSPLGELFGAPILGRLSDRTNPKKLLYWSMSGSIIGVLGSAMGITYQLWPLLLLSRLLGGFTAGSVAIIQSHAITLAPLKFRGRFLTGIEISVGLGLLFGPVIASKIAAPNILWHTDFSAPFWLAGALSMILLILFSTGFPDFHEPSPSQQPIKKVIRETPGLLKQLSAWLVLMLGWEMYLHWFPALMVRKFQYQENTLGQLFLMMGLFYVVYQFSFVKWVVDKLPHQKIIHTIIPGIAIGFIGLGFCTQDWMVYPSLILYLSCMGLLVPCWLTLMSNDMPTQHQGTLFGTLAAIASASGLVVTLFGAGLFEHAIQLPMIIAGTLVIIAWKIQARRSI